MNEIEIGYAKRFPRALRVQHVPVRNGHVDVVGIGRAVLSYPTMLADATARGKLEMRYVCRTFSDCTTAPRNGLRSGCYPLDEYYKRLPDAGALKDVKKSAAGHK